MNKPKEQSKGQHKSEEKSAVKKPAGKKLPETGDPVSLIGIGLASLIGARRLRRKK